jgi:hypothetical protein
MAWASVQSKSTIPASASSTTIALAFTSNVTAGACLVADVTWGQGSGTPTFSDNNGGSWSTDKVINDAGNSQSAATGSAPNHSAGATTVTATFGAASDFRALAIEEYSGIQTATPKDVTAGQTGTSASPTSGAATTTAVNDLNHGFIVNDSGNTSNVTAGAGFNSRETPAAANFTDLMTEDKNVATASSTSADGTIATSSAYIAIMVTYFEATGGGGGGGLPFFMQADLLHGQFQGLAGGMQ